MSDLLKIIGEVAGGFAIGLYVGRDLDLQEEENRLRFLEDQGAKISITDTEKFVKPAAAIATAGVDYFANLQLAANANVPESLIVGGAAYIGTTIGKGIASTYRNKKIIPERKMRILTRLAQHVQDLIVDEDSHYEAVNQQFWDDMHDARLRYRGKGSSEELSALEDYVAAFEFHYDSVKAFYERLYKDVDSFIIHKESNTPTKGFIIDTEKDGNCSLYELTITPGMFDFVSGEEMFKDKSKLMDFYISHAQKVDWDNGFKSLYKHVQEALNHQSVYLMKRK